MRHHARSRAQAKYATGILSNVASFPVASLAAAHASDGETVLSTQQAIKAATAAQQAAKKAASKLSKLTCLTQRNGVAKLPHYSALRI